MKGRMFCASQASTAICSSMDHIHKSTTTVDDVERSTGRAIDRHNPIIKDVRRSFAAPRSSVDDFIKIPASAEDGEIINKKLEIYKGGRRIMTGRRSTGGGATALLKLITNDMSLARKSFSCVARPAACGFIKTPPGSTRYLLGSDPDSISGSTPEDPVKTTASQSTVGKDKKSSSLLTDKKSCGGGGDGSDHVVVLKVSLHCRGCEEKVKKHLAKMEGVTSFNIDYAAKKVTVTGDITPLDILDSISKVKNAQFWTSPMPNLQTQKH